MTMPKLWPLFLQTLRYGTFALLGLLGASLWQWNQLHSLQPPAAQPTVALLKGEVPSAFQQQALQRLSQAIQTPTISRQSASPLEQAQTQNAFDMLHAQFQKNYPLIYRQLSPQRMGNSLLIDWPGQSKSAVLLAAHLDVVPAEADAWEQGPFSGALVGGYVWGRGTLDDKSTALAILEATERLLASGFKPRQDIYIALGEDEEIGGAQGAMRMAADLKAKGVNLAGVLDEGMLVVPGSMVGMEKPVALVGLAEKGYLTLELKVSQAGGHSSMPARETAVDILAQALVRLRQSPLPPRLNAPADQLFAWLAPEMKGFQRWALANLWLTESLLISQLQNKPATAALIQTTVAPTMLSASAKENVLASKASAVLNLRVLPGDTPEHILSHYQQAINDERVQIETRSASFSGVSSAVSSTAAPLFGQLTQTIKQTFPEALVAPSLVLAATDSRHYEGLSENIYRFQPLYLEPEDLDRLHGHNERISALAYLKSIGFFEQLLVNL
jgi:carboxypeptidase PM20D1